MKKVILSILILMFTAGFAYSQNNGELERADSLFALSDKLNQAGDYAGAISIITEVLEIQERVTGRENAGYATLLDRLASYKYRMGSYEDAISIETEALGIRERVLGKEHKDYAMSLNNLSIYISSLGNYVEAIKLGTEALEIRGRLFGRENVNYANTLNNLASYNSALGNYVEAIRLITEAMGIYENLYGKKNSYYVSSINNLARYYSLLGDYEDAIIMESVALEIFRRLSDKKDEYYAVMLNNLADYYSNIGNYEDAIQLGEEALRITEELLGKEHFNYTSLLSNLASYNAHTGNYAEALRQGAEVVEIARSILGEEHPYYALLLENLANYDYEAGEYADASECAVSVTETYSKMVRRTFSDLTANERMLYWNKYRGWYEGNLPELTYYIRDASLLAAVYDGTLLSKGLLLNSEIEMSKLIMESGDSAVVVKYEELKSGRALFNKIIESRYAALQSIADEIERAEYKVLLDAKIDSMEKRLEMRERELMEESKAYGDYTKNLGIGWREVQARLGEKDVAIEFLSFPAENDSIMYIALTLTKEDDVPHLIPLFENSELDRISKYDYYNSLELADLVWKPLSEVLVGKDNIYFAPAGELHNIAIESIPCYDGDGLMSDKWNLYRLSSTRELALIKEKSEIRSAYLYGNLKYDTDVETLVADAGNYTGIDRSVDWETVNIADSLDLRGSAQSFLNPLPATKEEVESIDKSLKSQDVNSTLLTETCGTESSFKALTGQKPSVLHIATHGFYWTETDAKKFGLSSMAMLNDNGYKYVEDKALTRSGLFFAGAANAFRKDAKIPEGVDDGVLTAKEISVLDLRGLDLVVLSACETGLGEITGDGVFGLQRGFKKAGAQTLMMSLWKVDDNATQILMTEFYSNLAKGENKFEALKEAQQYVRVTDDGKYSDPRYWAAFILLDGEIKN
ncbi:MAG: CHAT domain-containing protein [Prevotella sp.]|nr:CHAT domain-containing protein [Prevotella sp.]